MPPIDSLLQFAVLSFLIIIIPGPSVMFVVSRAVAHGRAAALITVWGNAAGQTVQVVLAGIGLGVVIEESAEVFTATKLIGAAYLVWLGLNAIRQSRSLKSLAVETPIRNRCTLLVDGFMVGLFNPKSMVFFAATLPQFVERGGAAAPLQMTVLGMIFLVIAVISDSTWGVCAGTARAWFVNSPKRMGQLSTGGGLMMIGLGLNLAMSRRNH